MDRPLPPWMKQPEPEPAALPPAPPPARIEQAYFDKTLRHLAAQGKRAIDEANGSCQYWTPEGLKCAVGCHIPDGHEAQFVNGGVPSLRIRFPDLAGVAWPNTEQGTWLAATLQQLHDSAENWDERGFAAWTEARGIARRYGLSVEVLDELELLARPE